VPLLAVARAGFVLWGNGLSWRDVVLSTVFYADHRPRHHRRVPPLLHARVVQGGTALRVALAVAGSMAIEGPVTRWVADHRRTTPSPTGGRPAQPVAVRDVLPRAVQGPVARARRLAVRRRADRPAALRPDLLADRAVHRVNRLFPVWVSSR
jgi:stearoyl-CoA desaturase (delta-9 desaturase)